MDYELNKQPFKDTLTINDLKILIDYDCDNDVSGHIELENTESVIKKE